MQLNCVLNESIMLRSTLSKLGTVNWSNGQIFPKAEKLANRHERFRVYSNPKYVRKHIYMTFS